VRRRVVPWMKRRRTRSIKEKKDRGEWAESVFIARASEHGLPVSKPWGDSNSFDCVVGRPGKFVAVQVKCTVAKLCAPRAAKYEGYREAWQLLREASEGVGGVAVEELAVETPLGPGLARMQAAMNYLKHYLERGWGAYGEAGGREVDSNRFSRSFGVRYRHSLSFRNGVAAEKSAVRPQRLGTGQEQIPPFGRNDRSASERQSLQHS